MITYLKGTVEKISENSVIIDVNGIGYLAICSSRTINEVKNYSESVLIFTVLNVREDSWTLYGFISERERFWFNALISVQGVGGKVAVAILSTLSDEDIHCAFLTGDKSAFTKAEGVGQKLATRIITELKDKIVGKIDVNAVSSMSAVSESSVLNDVVSALSNLGYQRGDIMRVVSSIQVESDSSFDLLLREALNKLSSGE